MRKQLLFAFLIFMGLQVSAQDWTGKVYQIGKIYPGFYVTLSNDTIQGYFYHDDKKGNQKKCRFYTNEMDRKPSKEFSPEEIKSYRVGDKTYRSINYSGGLLKKPLRFNLLVKDGAISEYVFYSEDASVEPRTVFHKPHDAEHSDPISIDYFGLAFAKKLADYLSDYPALSQKVKDKEKGYGLLNLLAIITEYNEWYAAKKK